MSQKESNSTPSGNPLQEGVDFYMENDYFVFTEKYLRDRGYCCGNGCRHCPYRKEDALKKQEKGT